MADNEKYACGYKNSQTGEIVYYKDKDARSQLKENQINLIEDDTSMAGISDTVHDSLETNDKTIIGAINEVNTQCADIANLSLTKHTDGKVYIKKKDGTLIGDGIEIGGSDVDLSKISMSMSGQTLKLLNDGEQVASVDLPSSGVDNSVKSSKTKLIGEIFDSEGKYTAWPLHKVQYDKDLDKIVFLYSPKPAHATGTGKTYMRTLDPNTYEVSESKLVAQYDDTDTYGALCDSFCICEDGTYLATVRYHESSNIDSYKAMKLYKSNDKGENWVISDIIVDGAVRNGSLSGLRELSNGRLITATGHNLIYSDDKGVTWTQVQTNAQVNNIWELSLCELTAGTLLAIVRQGVATDNGAYTGNPIKAPAHISVSRDYGTTWETFKPSKSILEMTANPCCPIVHKDEGLVELFYCSRLPVGDKLGTIYHQIATFEDALNDNFGDAIVIGYSKCTDTYVNASTCQNFGYMAGAKDNKNNIHLFYYDCDGKVADNGVNWNYILASREEISIPLNSNPDIISRVAGWTSASIKSYVSNILAPLNTKIAEIAIKVGVTPPSIEEGSMYITDGLVAHWNFIDSSTYDVDNYAIKDKLHDIPMYLNENTTNEWTFTTPTGDFNSYFDGNKGCTLRLATKTNSNGKDITDFFTLPNMGTLELLIYKNSSDIKSHILLGSTNRVAQVVGSDKDVMMLATGSRKIYYNNTSNTLTLNSKSVANFIPIDDNAYNHIFITVDTNTINIYKNNSLIQTLDFTSLVSDFSSFPNFFTNIALLKLNSVKCRLYNKVLTTKEIKNNCIYEKNTLGF